MAKSVKYINLGETVVFKIPWCKWHNQVFKSNCSFIILGVIMQQTVYWTQRSHANTYKDSSKFS